jgi:hypothetical protein
MLDDVRRSTLHVSGSRINIREETVENGFWNIYMSDNGESVLEMNWLKPLKNVSKWVSR